MLIVAEKCNGCEECLVYCPMGAIAMSGGVAVVNQDRCVECAACLRAAACPTKAFKAPVLTWPRSVRSLLSDPVTEIKETRLAGRGTEEMKTNEITGRILPGEVGFGIDVGRPGEGAYLRDVERILKAMLPVGIKIETKNPITSFIADRATLDFHPELRNERVLTAVIECKTDMAKVGQILDCLEKVNDEVDTVFSVCVSALEADAEGPLRELLAERGQAVRPNGKTNLGFGRANA